MYDLVIIGAGPAGLTAALYAGRYRLNTLVLERLNHGGQIVLSSTIDNYPGSAAGTSTQELMDAYRRQVDEVGVPFEFEEVTAISAQPAGYRITAQAKVYEARSLIIATGGLPRRLEVAGEERLTGKGVSYCGTCDGPFFRNKEVVVVGGGDRAVEEALFLARYASKVTLLHRRDQLRASAILQEQLHSEPRVTLRLSLVIDEILGDQRVEGLRLTNKGDGQTEILPCAGVFIFVGMQPHTGFVKSLLQTDELGFIITDQNMATSQPGIFACGDCRKKSLYQVVTACGDGATAAFMAFTYLMHKGK